MCRATDNLRSRQSDASQSGFSIIEVIIVVAIVMILAALTGRAMWSAVGTYRLTSAGRSIAALSQLAKIKATARNERYRVTANSATSTYRLERWNGSAWVPDAGAEDNPLPPGVTFVTTAVASPPTSGGMTLSAGPDTEMAFNTRGLLVNGTAPAPINSRCFYLTSSTTRVLAVCSTLAGRTTVYRRFTTVWEVM